MIVTYDCRFAAMVERDAHTFAARYYLDHAHSERADRHTLLMLARVHYRKALGLC